MLLNGFRTKFTTQVSQRQIVEGEAALPWTNQVGGQGGIGGDSVQHPAPPGQVVHGGLGFVQRLGCRRIGQPRAQRGLVLLGHGGDVDVGALAMGGRDRQRGGVGVVDAVGAHHREAGSPSVTGVRRQPGTHLARFQRAAPDVEALVDLRFNGGQGVEQPVPQHPELKIVEESVDLVAVPRQQTQRVRGLGQRHITHQMGEFPVEHHGGKVGP